MTVLPNLRRNQSGFSLVETLISTGLAAIILAASAALIANYSSSQFDPKGKAELITVMADLKTMMNLYDARVGPNVNCQFAFGAQTIDRNNPAPYDIYNPDGSTRFFKAPGPTQNLITPQWQISSVSLVPYGLSFYSTNQTLLFATLTVAAKARQGTMKTASESLPLMFVLDDTTNLVVGCSSASVTNQDVVQLPTCGKCQRLIYSSPTVGAQPRWVCQDLWGGPCP